MDDGRQRLSERLAVVEATLAALGRWPDITRMIAESADRAEALEQLMGPAFGFTEFHAHHVLDLTWSRLTRLGRQAFEEERSQLLAQLGDDEPDHP